MPIYEYRCTACGAVHEVYGQTAAAIAPPAACTCGKSNSFVRLYSVFAATASSEADSHECCGGTGECGHGGGSCACGHHADFGE